MTRVEGADFYPKDKAEAERITLQLSAGKAESAAAGSEGVVNFTAKGIQAGDDVFDAAVKLYLQALEKYQLIEPGFACGLDLDEQERYLQSQGRNTADMTERELREANTGTHVFLAADVRPIDAIEDVHVKIYL